MFHSSANSIIRLVLLPLSLLFYHQQSGQMLAVLSPIFVVMFMTLMPSKPPINLILKVIVALILISFGVVFFGSVLVDSPTGFVLYCWLLLFWSYQRSHQNTKDIIATLTIIVVIVMVVVNKQMHLPMAGLPLLFFEKLVIALIVTYLGFWLFPGDEVNVLPTAAVSDAPTTGDYIMVAFKATAVVVVLAILVGNSVSQTMLIAITLGSMLKSPSNHDHRTFSRNKLVTTGVGILFTLPVMIMMVSGAPILVIYGVSLVCGLQLACFAIRRQANLTIYQLLFTNFTTLAYQIISHPGSASLSAQMTRLFAIVCAVMVGALVLGFLSSNTNHSHTDHSK
ncbi:MULTISPECIES: multidrug DMT transporter permease [unclassified Vibrio]|uniref:multidrug DMT transporter permease n=1 Tax=unclassified Vibrio TaxID=2614977 RepID=UPI0035528EA2